MGHHYCLVLQCLQVFRPVLLLVSRVVVVLCHVYVQLPKRLEAGVLGKAPPTVIGELIVWKQTKQGLFAAPTGHAGVLGCGTAWW